MAKKWQYLDAHLRLRLAFLDPRMFEEFFLHFLRAGISLTINRHGQKMTRRVISADRYAAGCHAESERLLVPLGRRGNWRLKSCACPRETADLLFLFTKNDKSNDDGRKSKTTY